MTKARLISKNMMSQIRQQIITMCLILPNILRSKYNEKFEIFVLKYHAQKNIVCSSRDLPNCIKTKGLTTCFYLI